MRSGRICTRSAQWKSRSTIRKKLRQPEYLLAIPAQVKLGIRLAPDKQLIDPIFGSQLLEGLLGIGDRKRHQDGPRPGRDLVDVEVAPIGKEDELRRNGRHGVVFVLAEETEIDLGEGITFNHAAMLENPLPGMHHDRVLRQASPSA